MILGLPGGPISPAALGGASIKPPGNQRRTGLERPKVGPGHLETGGPQIFQLFLMYNDYYCGSHLGILISALLT